MRRAAFLCLCFTGWATPADLLTGFQPSPRQSAHGPVLQVEFATRPLDVEPGSLALHLPGAMLDFRFGEAVWIIGYKTTIIDMQGREPKENHLCHTFFGDQRVMQTGDQEVRGLYSDHYTPEIQLPDGFGVRVPANEPLHWMPMFNNRAADSVRVRMRVVLSVIKARDVTKPLTPLYATLRSAQTPHLYFVKPGRDERKAEFELPFQGRIHFLGTHIHPYGSSVELFNLTRNERVWRGGRKVNGAGEMTGFDHFSNAEGYPVKAGDKFRVSAIYENPTSAPIDAMAGLYILYSRLAR